MLKNDDIKINGSLGKEANVLPTSATAAVVAAVVAAVAVAVTALATLEDADNAAKIVSLVCIFFMSANYKKLKLMLCYRIGV